SRTSEAEIARRRGPEDRAVDQVQRAPDVVVTVEPPDVGDEIADLVARLDRVALGVVDPQRHVEGARDRQLLQRDAVGRERADAPGPFDPATVIALGPQRRLRSLADLV